VSNCRRSTFIHWHQVICSVSDQICDLHHVHVNDFVSILVQGLFFYSEISSDPSDPDTKINFSLELPGSHRIYQLLHFPFPQYEVLYRRHVSESNP